MYFHSIIYSIIRHIGLGRIRVLSINISVSEFIRSCPMIAQPADDNSLQKLCNRFFGPEIGKSRMVVVH